MSSRDKYENRKDHRSTKRQRSQSRSPERNNHRYSHDFSRHERRRSSSREGGRCTGSRRREHMDSPRDKREYRHRYRESRDNEPPFNYTREPKRYRGSPEVVSNVPPEVGSIHRGRVHTVKPFGIFISLRGFERHALVHSSQVSEEVSLNRDDDDNDKIRALEYFCPTGSEVWLKVIEVQEDARGLTRINASLKAVDQESGRDLDPENQLAVGGRQSGRGGPYSEEPPELGSIHRAKIAALKPFGAFVQLEGFRAGGLVHVSQVSDHMGFDKEESDEAKVAALGEVVSVGEAVWVKVVEIKEAEPGSGRGPKLSCSMKLVSQQDGRDLDPNSLQYRPKPGSFQGAAAKQPVGAQAGQVHHGSIDWGHLNAEKVNLDPDYKGKYDLLEGDDDPEGLPADGRNVGGKEPATSQQLPPPPPRITSVQEALAILRKHEKKVKKGKAKKKHKHKDSKKSLKKAAKKAAKKAKRKKKSASSSTSSESGSE